MKLLDDLQKKEIINILKVRFENNMHRHPNIEWEMVFNKLINQPEKIWSLNEMNITGGEPDVISFNKDNDEYMFCDCSKETPVARRNICYDLEALDKRKQFKPLGNAINMAKEMGIEILNEEQYRNLQEIEEVDLKTSSWIKTPVEIRKLGGAIFGDRRYNTVFIYHNGADSYYSVRGFRGLIRI